MRLKKYSSSYNLLKETRNGDDRPNLTCLIVKRKLKVGLCTGRLLWQIYHTDIHKIECFYFEGLHDEMSYKFRDPSSMWWIGLTLYLSI